MKVQVQTVIYNNESNQLDRFFLSLKFAIKQAKLDFPACEFALKTAINESSESKLSKVKQTSKKLSLDLQQEIYLFEENHGFAHAHNAMMSGLSGSDYVLFLNPDGLLDLKAISFLIEFMQLNSTCGAVEAKQVPFSHPKKFSFTDCDTGWISLACALVRSDLLEWLGGLDERFFVYCEDVDLSWRIRGKGFSVNICNKSRFYHEKQIGLNGFIEVTNAETKYGVLSALLLAHKYGLKRKVNAMIRDLESSEMQIHQEVLGLFRDLKKIYPVSDTPAPSDIPKNTWKFAHTFYD